MCIFNKTFNDEGIKLLAGHQALHIKKDVEFWTVVSDVFTTLIIFELNWTSIAAICKPLFVLRTNYQRLIFNSSDMRRSKTSGLKGTSRLLPAELDPVSYTPFRVFSLTPVLPRKIDQITTEIREWGRKFININVQNMITHPCRFLGASLTVLWKER